MRQIDIAAFATYLIISTISVNVAVVLFFSKNTFIKSPKKALYERGRKLVAISALIEGLTDVVIVSRMVYNNEYLCLNKFFVPTTFFFEMTLMFVAMLNFLHSNKYSLQKMAIFIFPVTAIVLLHAITFISQYGFVFHMPAYEKFLNTRTSIVLATLLDIAIISEAIFSIIIIIRKAISFHRHIDNYVCGPAVARSHWLTHIVGIFMLFFVVSAADFLVSTRNFDILTMWLKTIVFIVATVCGLNLQDIYIDISPAFDNKSESAQPTTADKKELAATTSQTPTVPTNSQIADIVDKWTNNSSKPFLAESITINQVAEQMQLNKRQLSQFLNNTLNMNFNTWINSLKVEEAKRMIVDEPDLSLYNIALRTGFTDAPAMSRIFKSRCGITPSAYRLQNS